MSSTFTSTETAAIQPFVQSLIQGHYDSAFQSLRELQGEIYAARASSGWGYLLAPVGMLKFLTVGIAVSLMGFKMLRVGVPFSAVTLGVSTPRAG